MEADPSPAPDPEMLETAAIASSVYEWQMGMVSYASSMFHEMLELLQSPNVDNHQRMSVIVLLKLVMCDRISLDAFADYLRPFLDDHDMISLYGLQVLTVALPVLRTQMATTDVFIDGHNLNEELGVYMSPPDDPGAGRLLFGSGELEMTFGLEHLVQQNMNAMIYQQQLLQQQGYANGLVTEVEISRLPSVSLVLAPPRTHYISECVHLFKTVLQFLNRRGSVPRAQIVSVIAHMKCLIMGTIAAETFMLAIQPALQRLARYRPDLPERLNSPFLYKALPILRSAMEKADLVDSGFNLNRELGVLVHKGPGLWSMIPMARGATESRLHLEAEVIEKVKKLTETPSAPKETLPSAKRPSQAEASKPVKITPRKTPGAKKGSDGEDPPKKIRKLTNEVVRRTNPPRLRKPPQNILGTPTTPVVQKPRTPSTRGRGRPRNRPATAPRAKSPKDIHLFSSSEDTKEEAQSSEPGRSQNGRAQRNAKMK